MEIFTLLETLEDILEKSKTLPFTDKSIVEKEQILDIIKEIRLKLPDELKQAKWIKEERERIINEAQKDADDIVKEAGEKRFFGKREKTVRVSALAGASYFWIGGAMARVVESRIADKMFYYFGHNHKLARYGRNVFLYTNFFPLHSNRLHH